MKTEETIIDDVNVAGCRHCSDNHNVLNRCYSDINESYRDCKPKEYQCDFYVKRLEQENETINKDLLTERQENAELATENHNLRKALEAIREILNVKCSIVSNAECVGIINEVLNESN